MALASTRFVELFCAIVETGSFTAAAQQLSITPAAVSRTVAKHESLLGAALFRRSTRSIKLTDAGADYFERCRQALTLLEDAERHVMQRQTRPRGTVRISAPTTYGHYRLLPFIATFRERYPDVGFDINISNRNIDFVAEGYDLAIRMGVLDDSALVIQKLEEATLGVYASPDYLKKHGVPKTPADLEHHSLIAFLRPSTGRILAYLFVDQNGVPFEVAPKRTLRCSDDFLGCITLARAGAGMTQAYRFIVEDDLRRGTLVEVLASFTGRTNPFSLLRPARREPGLAVRLFADELLAACRPPKKTS